MSKSVSSGVVLSQEARDNLVPTPKSVKESQLATAVAEKLIPPGTIIEFAGPTAPEGFLVCDGSPLDKTLFANLFNKVGYKWGNPGGNDFNLPDLRGRITRMQDLGAGVEPPADVAARTPLGDGAAGDVGSIQGDATKTPNAGNWSVSGSASVSGSVNSHDHGGGSHTHNATARGNGSTPPFQDFAIGDAVSTFGDRTTKGPNSTVIGSESPGFSGSGSISGSATGGDLESRMKNAYVNKCIKY